MSVRNIAILGCGGFIGSHLLERLLEAREYVIEGWDATGAKIRNLVNHSRFKFNEVDIASDESLLDRIGEFDLVISLAAICNPAEYNMSPLAVIESNFTHVQNIVSACARGSTWLIHFSTCEVYGRTLPSYLGNRIFPQDDPAFELREDETPLVMGPIHRQRWSYAAAKQLSERYIFAHHQENQLEFTIVRPFNVMGPRMDYIPGVDGEGKPRVLASFVAALLRREPIKLVDGGRAQRTFIYIDDAIDALEHMLCNPDMARNQIFNIGNRDNEVTVAQLACLMREVWAEITGDSSYLEHPIEEVSSLEFYGAGYEDCDRRVPDVRKLALRFGWKAKTNLEETLRKTLCYYFEEYGTDTSLRVM